MPLPKLPPYPENLLSRDARQRIERAWDEYDLIKAQALAALENRYRADPNGCDDFMQFLSRGQAGIDFAESRIRAASAVHRAEAEEFGKLGLPGHEFRGIMEDKIETMGNSMEFSTLQKAAFKTEFMRPTQHQPEGASRVFEVWDDPTLPAKDRVLAFMDKKRLDIPAFAKMINFSKRTVTSVLAGDRVGKQTQIAVAKALLIETPLSQWARWEASTSGKAQKRSRCIDLPSNAVLCRAFDGLASYNSGQDGRQIR
jgi:hypothetical protein